MQTNLTKGSARFLRLFAECGACFLSYTVVACLSNLSTSLQ